MIEAKIIFNMPYVANRPVVCEATFLLQGKQHTIIGLKINGEKKDEILGIWEDDARVALNNRLRQLHIPKKRWWKVW